MLSPHYLPRPSFVPGRVKLYGEEIAPPGIRAPEVAFGVSCDDHRSIATGSRNALGDILLA